MNLLRKLKLANLGFALTVTLCCLTSCNGDNENEPKEYEEQTPSSNMTEESKKFMGYWRGGNFDFMFFDDGHAYMYYVYASSNTRGAKDCYWVYDNTTKTLATTEGYQQFKITIQTDNEWGAINLGNNKACSFSRQFPFDEMLAHGSWVNAKGEILKINFYKATSSFFTISLNGKSIGRNEYINISIAEKSFDEEVDYSLYYTDSKGNFKYNGKGTIKIQNAYSYMNRKVTFTGTLNDTFNFKP